jgi:kumamolisin
MTNSNRISVPGSHKERLSGASLIGPAPLDERLEVTVRIRPQQPLTLDPTMSSQSLGQRRYLTREEYEGKHGASAKDLEQVASFAKQNGLSVVESSAARRSVVLSGTVEAFNKAFGVELQRYDHPNGAFRARTGEIYVPPELGGVVEGVFGLSDYPFARPHIAKFEASPGATSPAPTTFTPPDLAKLYNFPTGATGQNQCIGIIELGGGYRTTDLKSYFKRLKMSPPNVQSVSVDHGHNHPTGSPNGPDGEVMLDIEVAAGVAPAAKIVVYTAPNTLQGFLDALTTAVHDKKNSPSVISISWGGPETSAEANFLQQFDQALQGAAALGVTVCCSAGDDGAADMRSSGWDGKAHVDFPASSPYVLACGGTRMEASNGQIVRETVWNQKTVVQDSFGSTGGGVSDFFPLASWQQDAGVPKSVNTGGRIGRGVPDVAGVADPATGYDIQVDGNYVQGFGGTSAVAPLWAGLVALMNESLRKSVGYLNPLLYSAPISGAFHDVTDGDNKVGAGNIGYSAGPGWDACTGLGSPDGQRLLNALRGGA